MSGGGQPVVVGLHPDQIEPNPFQPRREFDEEALAHLADSIRRDGLMQPILVRPAGDAGAAGRYQLVAGERRWRAAQLIELGRVPAIVRELTDEQSAEWALVENLQREELSTLERADGLKALVDRFGLTHGEIAERVALDRSSVSNLIRLTELEPEVRALIEDGRLTAGHGKALLGADVAGRVGLATHAADHMWSVRKLESAIREPKLHVSATPSAGEVAGADEPDPHAIAIADLERQLGEHLGTKVHIRTTNDGKRGRVTIEFFDLDHFDGLMSQIGFVAR